MRRQGYRQFNRFTKGTLASGSLYGSAGKTYAGKRVAAIHNFSYMYGSQNYPAVIAALRAEAAANPGGIADQAIKEIVRLYNL